MEVTYLLDDPVYCKEGYVIMSIQMLAEGEAGSDVYDRINDLLGSLYRDFAKDGFPENCVHVTHGLAIRLFIMRFFHLTVEEFERMLAPKNCDLVILELQEDGHCRLTKEMTYSTEPLRYSRPIKYN